MNIDEFTASDYQVGLVLKIIKLNFNLSSSLKKFVKIKTNRLKLTSSPSKMENISEQIMNFTQLKQFLTKNCLLKVQKETIKPQQMSLECNEIELVINDHKNVQSQGCQMLSSLLSRLSNLMKLSFKTSTSNYISQKGCFYLSTALENLKGLEYIYLHLGDYNNITFQGLHSLCSSISQLKKVKVLKFKIGRYNKIGILNDGSNNSLVPYSPSLEQITYFIDDNNDLSMDNIPFLLSNISQINNLNKFSLSAGKNSLDSSSIEKILIYNQQIKSLKKLKITFSQNNIESYTGFSEILVNMKQLESLQLEIIKLSKAVSSLTQLKELSLDFYIGLDHLNKKVQIIGNGLKNNINLQTLELKLNNGMLDSSTLKKEDREEVDSLMKEYYSINDCFESNLEIKFNKLINLKCLRLQIGQLMIGEEVYLSLVGPIQQLINLKQLFVTICSGNELGMNHYLYFVETIQDLKLTTLHLKIDEQCGEQFIVQIKELLQKIKSLKYLNFDFKSNNITSFLSLLNHLSMTVEQINLNNSIHITCKRKNTQHIITLLLKVTKPITDFNNDFELDLNQFNLLERLEIIIQSGTLEQNQVTKILQQLKKLNTLKLLRLYVDDLFLEQYQQCIIENIACLFNLRILELGMRGQYMHKNRKYLQTKLLRLVYFQTKYKDQKLCK